MATCTCKLTKDGLPIPDYNCPVHYPKPEPKPEPKK
jgi:hypothetical protein